MAGRPRKPVALKKLEGTYRKDRNPDNPVELPAELPTKPDWVDHDAIAAGMIHLKIVKSDRSDYQAFV